jgi:hypothetical protein
MYWHINKGTDYRDAWVHGGMDASLLGWNLVHGCMDPWSHRCIGARM